MAGAGRRGGVPARVRRVPAARVQPQSGPAGIVRPQPPAVAGEAAEGVARASGDGRAGGGSAAEPQAVAGSGRLELPALPGFAGEGGDGDRLRGGHGRHAAVPARGGSAGFRDASRLRRQGGREPFDGPCEPEHGRDPRTRTRTGAGTRRTAWTGGRARHGRG